MTKTPSSEQRKAYRKASSENLSDAYVKAALRMPFINIPPELIAMKREQLQIYRATRQLVKTLEEQKKPAA